MKFLAETCLAILTPCGKLVGHREGGTRRGECAKTKKWVLKNLRIVQISEKIDKKFGPKLFLPKACKPGKNFSNWAYPKLAHLPSSCELVFGEEMTLVLTPRCELVKMPTRVLWRPTVQVFWLWAQYTGQKVPPPLCHQGFPSSFHYIK